MTGHEVIDMNRVMEVIQFLYRQGELARRGPNYLVDDFGFDAEWTESFLSVFKVLYRDYWRAGRTGKEKLPAPPPPLLCRNPARAPPAGPATINTAMICPPPPPHPPRAPV